MELGEIITGSIPSSDRAADIMNSFCWNLYIEHTGTEWILFGGEKLMLTSPNRETIDAFIYGAAFALGTLPEQTQQHIRQVIGADMCE